MVERQNCKPAVTKNAIANGVQNLITSFTATPENISESWPLVLANIQYAVFLKTVVQISNLVQQNETLIISGVLKEQLDDCLKLWPNLKIVKVKFIDEWVAVILKKETL